MWRNILILAVTIVIGAAFTYMLDYSDNVSPPQKMMTTEPHTVIKTGRRVPDFTFTTLDGDQKSIRDFKGKVVVLNFWASWCAPCVKEFPHFLKLAKNYTNRIVFIGLSSDHDMASMNRFLSKMDYQNPQAMSLPNVLIALDEQGEITREIFQTYRLPETILIDEKGYMREKLIGADWAYEDLATMVEGL